MVINMLWGSFDANRNWFPNPDLIMSGDEQYKRNAEVNPDMMRNYKNCSFNNEAHNIDRMKDEQDGAPCSKGGTSEQCC